MASITAANIIKATLKEIGVLGIGQTVNAEVETDALASLNRMLESWSLEGLMVSYDTEGTGALTSGTAVYTMGSGGTWTTRPVEFKDECFIRDSGGLDYPIQRLTMDVYRLEPLKTSAGRPDYFAYQPEWPLGKVYFYPTPDSSTDVFHYKARCQLTSFAEAGTSVDLPVGYELAIITNLAIVIAPANRKNIRAETAKMAEDSKHNIRRQTIKQRGAVRLDDLAKVLSGRGGRSIIEGPFA